MKRYQALVVFSFEFLIISCTQGGNDLQECKFDDLIYHMGFGEKSIRYDVFITWREKPNKTDKSDVNYFWNDENIGVGKAGFMAILENISKMPEEGRILAFPDYSYLDEYDPKNPWSLYPFEDDIEKLLSVLKSQKSTLSLSPRDQDGKLTAEYRRFLLKDIGIARNVPFDYYLTWRNIAGENPFQVEGIGEMEFIWQGEVLGTGETGFNKLLDIMNSLKTGSKILIFPDLPWYCNYDHHPVTVLEELRKVREHRGIQFLVSLRDEKGRISKGNEEVFLEYLTFRTIPMDINAWASFNEDTENKGDENIEYIWNGVVIGKGEQGFSMIINKIRNMPSSSRVLLYPSEMYLECFPESPFTRNKNELIKVSLEREIEILFSVRDHLGKIHNMFKKEPVCFMDVDDKQINYDVYVRLTGDMGSIYLNGKKVGNGDEGIAEVVKYLKKLPERSKILAYPGYNYGRFTLRNFIGSLAPILKKGNHVLMLSPRNEKGQICEDYRGLLKHFQKR